MFRPAVICCSRIVTHFSPKGRDNKEPDLLSNLVKLCPFANAHRGHTLDWLLPFQFTMGVMTEKSKLCNMKQLHISVLHLHTRQTLYCEVKFSLQIKQTQKYILLQPSVIPGIMKECLVHSAHSIQSTALGLALCYEYSASTCVCTTNTTYTMAKRKSILLRTCPNL